MKLNEFFGQKDAVENLRVLIESSRSGTFPHTLLTGGYGLGKTTMARLIASELGYKFIEVNSAYTGSSSESKLKLMVALEDITANDIIFLDEIHALNKGTQEMLYTAMENNYINYDGYFKRVIPPFTIVGATTDLSGLTNAMQSRFRHVIYLKDYDDEDIGKIISGVDGQVDAAELAKYCRGNPRHAKNYLDWVVRYCKVNGIPADAAGIQTAMHANGVFQYGLTTNDINYINLLKAKKVLGVRNISHMLNIEEKTVKTKIEPYLMKLGILYIIQNSGKRSINMPRLMEMGL